MARAKWRDPRIRWWLVLLAVVLPSGMATWRIGRFLDPPSWKKKTLAGLDLIPRAAWNVAPANKLAADLGPRRRITVHHSGGAVYTRTSFRAVTRTIRAIQREHQEDRGWSDIAYHLIIDPAGRLWEGRSLRERGAHAGSFRLNEGNIGIVLLGNFSLQEPSPQQLGMLEKLLRGLRQVYGIPAANVYTHKEIREAGGLATTECPGKHLERWLRELSMEGDGEIAPPSGLTR